MNPTELSEVSDIEKICDEAIANERKVRLLDLEMIPWNRKLPNIESYSVPESGIFLHIQGRILPVILEKLPGAYGEPLGKIDHALGEVFKNAFEEARELDIPEIQVEHSPLEVMPIEFLFYSQSKEVSPFFVKYWKHQKDLQRASGFCDLDLNFYTFSRQQVKFGKRGNGLILAMDRTKEMGFYRDSEGNLLNYLMFGENNT